MKLTLYDLDALIRQKTNNEQKAFYTNQEAALFEGEKGFLLAYFNSKYSECNSTDDTVELELLDIDATDDVWYSFDNLTVTAADIKTAPSKEIDSVEFFHARNINGREMMQFLRLKSALQEIGLPEINKI